MKSVGKFQINKKFLKFLDKNTKQLLKKNIWSKIKMLSIDYDNYDVYTIYAHSEELFRPIVIGRQTIPFYHIILHTGQKGELINVSLKNSN